MWSVISAVLALLGAGLAYFISLLLEQRRKFDGLVQFSAFSYLILPCKKGPTLEEQSVLTITICCSHNHHRVDSGVTFRLQENARNCSRRRYMFRIGRIIFGGNTILEVGLAARSYGWTRASS